MSRLRLLLAAIVALAALPAWAELPEVEAAAANLWVKRTPPRTSQDELEVKDQRGRPKRTSNHRAGVPGMVVTVQFPPASAELDEPQKLALYKLTREWRARRDVRLLWVRAGGDGDSALARKRAEALRRATGGKGFPWNKVYLDAAWDACTGDDCADHDRRGTITVIEAR